MFSASLFEFETHRDELHRRAAQYRLAKSFGEPSPWTRKALSRVGKLMVETGQQLVRNHRSVQTARC